MAFSPSDFGWQSELGAVLDPIADKVLLVTVFVTLSLMKLVPLWLMVAAVARDVDHRVGRRRVSHCHRATDGASVPHQQDQHAVSGSIYIGIVVRAQNFRCLPHG